MEWLWSLTPFGKLDMLTCVLSTVYPGFCVFCGKCVMSWQGRGGESQSSRRLVWKKRDGAPLSFTQGHWIAVTPVWEKTPAPIWIYTHYSGFFFTPRPCPVTPWRPSQEKLLCVIELRLNWGLKCNLIVPLPSFLPRSQRLNISRRILMFSSQLMFVQNISRCSSSQGWDILLQEKSVQCDKQFWEERRAVLSNELRKNFEIWAIEESGAEQLLGGILTKLTLELTRSSFCTQHKKSLSFAQFPSFDVSPL